MGAHFVKTNAYVFLGGSRDTLMTQNGLCSFKLWSKYANGETSNRCGGSKFSGIKPVIRMVLVYGLPFAF